MDGSVTNNGTNYGVMAGTAENFENSVTVPTDTGNDLSQYLADLRNLAEMLRLTAREGTEGLADADLADQAVRAAENGDRPGLVAALAALSGLALRVAERLGADAFLALLPS